MSSDSPTSLWLRAAWVAIALLVTALFLASLPANYTAQSTPCLAAPCLDGQLTPAQVKSLAASGISPAASAAVSIILYCIIGLVSATVGALVFWRRGDDRMALFVSLALITFGMATVSSDLYVLGQLHPALAFPVGLAYYLGDLAIAIVFYTFPDGHFVPRGTKVLAVLWALTQLPNSLFRDLAARLGGWYSIASTIAFAAFLLSFMAAQIYRYRHVSNQMQRQQTKWIVYGLSVTISGMLALELVWALAPSIGAIELASTVAAEALAVLIPLSFGMAILRARLWDIDIIIRRTLIYGLLTAVLALVYAVSVILLEQVVRVLLGQRQPEAVTVVSTLAIAILFAPLRGRIQDAVDRQFYRRKYDATRTLAAFSASVRDEVDLERLAGKLVTLVQETMQPAELSVWLARERKN